MYVRILAAVALGMCVAATVGCNKKTKIQEPTAATAQPPAPIHSAEDAGELTTADMDAQTREILVPVYFDYDRYNLRADAVGTMDRIAAFLDQNNGIRVLIEGHADERGTDEYNMGLAENRARSARNFLTGYGIAANRIEMVTFGKNRPVNPQCDDDACHQLNRRVEWKVLAR
jgi:peptidoglycan-associated lipoprotein